jgi:predicted transcriptional regulator
LILLNPGGPPPDTLPCVKVDNILTPGVVRIERSATLEAAAPPYAELTETLTVMRSRGVRRLLVMRSDAALAGLVSLDDIVDALVDQLAGLSGILRSELEREMARSWTG